MCLIQRGVLDPPPVDGVAQLDCGSTHDHPKCVMPAHPGVLQHAVHD
jgi:hypothetical protein